MTDFSRPADFPRPADAPTLAVMRLAHGEGVDLPAYETAGSAGMDLRAALPADAPLVINPGDRALIPTGLAMVIPSGFEGQIRPRSGLATRFGVTCLNTPGTIDSDYRGEVKVLLINLGNVPVEIARGLRMAQLVIAPVVQARLDIVESLDGTARGAGGFGSTGTA